MTQITLTEAQLHLSELIAKLQPGEELQICQDDRPLGCDRPEIIARLTIEPRKIRKPRQTGSAIGTFTIVADDDDHLEAFSEYMP